VLPPIAKLTPAQAMYHFLSGYTAKVAGTEGREEPEATFSACFGAPFLPRHPTKYGELLRREARQAPRDLAGQHRLDGRRPRRRQAHVPTAVPGIEPHILDPIKTWASKSEFAETAKKLVKLFQDNFVTFEPHVDAKVKDSAPQVRAAAE
jgi:phosphoenolpyruvate carboxykinase (ATP)